MDFWSLNQAALTEIGEDKTVFFVHSTSKQNHQTHSTAKITSAFKWTNLRLFNRESKRDRGETCREKNSITLKQNIVLNVLWLTFRHKNIFLRILWT